ncbi:bifunctional oligoribonuclease/PAP phosphatase NrnA [Weissella cibaria]|jgi:Exopolyphosphatase-related proteins|uniref:NrnA_2 protein n=1 Tax=Weissella cibaria TaxID=137591 RepID=A0A0D1LMX9_9LACO|nr:MULTISPECIES: bifunctional oligoribonuclease/PAP phosphatase NrnA [Weissella]ALI33202.1 phosphoesterase [Weissella cibaria]APS27310.1 putative bifunctional oligoribonuclease and PAP phosphatase NrnA [Weissella cibaria]APU62707.1 putative bifunctional oligoribonuclease and PAP phosphatase NrnA [Weissella cibaria]APU64859.1 putative bifunctional oligoribonuclease and PAP phosphatase NrnA [Weissella cibaria]ASS51764.1 putative bifunctional oligoribonuclease and PAP phosphatase NrnA [Weissella 
MTAQTAILAQIKAADTIIIHRHQRPDPDAFGSQFGLAELIKTSFPEKQVHVVGKQVPSMTWMGEMEQIPDSLYDDALVIVTDTANSPRVDDRRFDYGKVLVKIDHHPNDEPYGDYTWVIEGASSTSAMIFAFYKEFEDELTLSDAGASYLYAGIVGDTGRFLYATKSETMQVVADLMKFDFDWFKINQQMDTISVEAARASGYVYNNMVTTDNGFNYIILTNEVVENFNLGDFGTAFIVPLLGKINTVKAWAVFEQQDDGFFRVRLRSRNTVINEIAKRHGGGGHKFASGAFAKDIDEVHEIIREADETLKEQTEA